MAFSDVEAIIDVAFPNYFGDGIRVQPYLKLLYNCAIKSPEGAIVEVGSYAGYSSVALAQACRETGKQFISLDPYPVMKGVYSYDDEIGIREAEASYAKHVGERFPESIQYKNDILECIDKIPSVLSVVFIDGFHDSNNTEREWELLFPRIVPQGWIILDDITWENNLSGIGTGGPALTAKRFNNTEIFDLLVKASDRGLMAGRKR